MDCKGCAKCCYLVHPYLDVELSDTDALRVPGSMFTRRHGGPDNELLRWMNRRPNGACIALDEQTLLCTIYDSRPDECREFDQSHPVCELVRGSTRRNT